MTYRFFYLSYFFVFFLFSACDKKENTQSDGNPLWKYENDLIKNGESLPIEPYNEAIEKALSMRLPWAYSPVSVALRVVGQQMISSQFNLAAKSLSGNELITHTVVIVEKKGLLDDSVESEYYRVELKLGGSIWQVTQVHKGWRCRENRGHQQLSAEICQ